MAGRAGWTTTSSPGGTTFHFVTEGPEAALERAREAADGRDVRVGGGAATLQQYLCRGAIDELHLALVPVLLAEVSASSHRWTGSRPAVVRPLDGDSVGPGGARIPIVEPAGVSRAPSLSRLCRIRSSACRSAISARSSTSQTTSCFPRTGDMSASSWLTNPHRAIGSARSLQVVDHRADEVAPPALELLEPRQGRFLLGAAVGAGGFQQAVGEAFTAVLVGVEHRVVAAEDLVGRPQHS